MFNVHVMMAPDIVNMAASSSSSSSSCPPSSSALTITTPGKSILKRPPPQQPSLFSRITRFLPTQAPPPQNVTPNDESKPLKRAHFILPEIAIVYPISSINPPSTPTLKDEKRAIEDKEKERRKRVVRGNPGGQAFEEWWSMDKVESFYRECCAGCDELPDLAIKAALKNTSPTNPRTVDLSGVQLTFTSASILSDVFSIEWGLRKLVFRECDLDDSILKPMLHALLIPGTLSFLSVASNRRLKTAAFRLIGAYVKKAKSLQFLDLSQNILDKKSMEYIVASLETAPEPGLVSLRLDDCSLRPAALEVLCRAVRTSSLRNISLRHNRISVTGGVALALMIRDYPDVVPTPISVPPSPPATSTSFPSPSPVSSVSNLSITSPPSTPTPSVPNPPFVRSSLVPPPRHPAVSMQTTYTPYVPRARRGKDVATAVTNPLSPTGQHIPIITSSSQGGVTTRHPTPGGSGTASGDGYRHDAGPSAALLDKVRALDSLPRLGALKTLDLKGNDLRSGISYIAQVLKRNRTLKVLNLSENKLDVQCLVIIAEALKYNSSLETLDLNKNPCSGPGLEGIQSLRTAFTLNTALKRLFLSSTSMTSAGAIALAEFLPESTSLLHLDLTMNSLDIAGVMALSSGLKANHVMRCLDVNIPPGDEEFARMCREILNSCVRNTEEAERLSKVSEGASVQSGRGLRKGVWGMIEESELAKSIRKGEEKMLKSDIMTRALRCVEQLKHVLSLQTSPQSTPKAGSNAIRSTVGESRVVTSELASMIQETNDAERLEELLNVNDQLLNLLKKVPGLGKPTLTLQSLDVASQNIIPTSVIDCKLDGTPHINGRPKDRGEEESSEASSVDCFEDSPTTPKIDKGKGKAEPEPEEPEKVLSPRISINDSEDEDEDGVTYEDAVEVPGASPTDRSRIWVAEEGEVFRKGTVLLGPAEMEGEYAGEELRKELLEAMVERPPPRPLTDEFGTEVLIPGFAELAATGDRSPISPIVTSPTLDTTLKSAPKPYISRSKSSSNSTLNLISPISSTEYLETTLTPTSPTIGGRPP